MSKADYDRSYYQTHRKAILEKRQKYQEDKRAEIQTYRRNRREERLAKLYEIKSGPCKDCGRKFHPWQMEFDHLRDKKFNVSSLIGYGNNWETVLAEIAKCDLVCANCHNHRTYIRTHPACLVPSLA